MGARLLWLLLISEASLAEPPPSPSPTALGVWEGGRRLVIGVAGEGLFV